MSKPSNQQITAAVRAARHFTFVANGRMQGTNTGAAFKRDAQLLVDSLAEMGVVAQADGPS